MNIKIIVLVGFVAVFLIIITANNDDDPYASTDSSSESVTTTVVAKSSQAEAPAPVVETKQVADTKPEPTPEPVTVTRRDPEPMPVRQEPVAAQQAPQAETVCFFIPQGVQFNGQPPEALRTSCATGKPLYPVAFDQAIRAMQQQQMAAQAAAQQQVAANGSLDGPVFHGGPLDGIPNLSPFPDVAQANYDGQQRDAQNRANERELQQIRNQGVHDCRKACIRDATNVSLCKASCGSY